jgi:hypothetical protein
MDRQKVAVSAVQCLNRENGGSRQRSRAHVSTHWPRFAPQNAPRNDLHFIAVGTGFAARAHIRTTASSTCGLASPGTAAGRVIRPLAAFGKIAMGITMGDMLILML